MWKLQSLTNEEQLRISMIVDMGLGWSAMMRVFEKGSKTKLSETIKKEYFELFFNSRSKKEFQTLHNDFCEWGTSAIRQARSNEKASYGQIAKTLDVLLKVAVYYCHLPDCEHSKELCNWMNAAVDNAMMQELRNRLSVKSSHWPHSLKDVGKADYQRIQEMVKQQIRLEHKDSITCPQWDDIYWQIANK